MRLLNFVKENGNLRLTLTEAGREELPSLIERYENDTTSIMHELMEHQLGNGWENIPPETIGALTDCDLILSDSVERDEASDIVKVGKIYCHQSYMVENPVERLQEGSLILHGA